MLRPRNLLIAAATVTSLVLGLAPQGTAAPSAASVRQQLDETLDRLGDAQAREATLRDELVRLQREVARDEKLLAAVQERLSRRARVAYTGGLGGDTFEVMLTSSEPDDVLERLSLLEAANRGDRDLLTAGKVARRRVQLAKQRVEEARRKAARLVADIKADTARLNRLLAAAGQAEAARVRSRRASRSSAAASSGGGAVRMSGRYACLVGPNHAYRDTWGAPRSGGRRHKGTDVFAPWGSPAYAVTDGVVTRTSSSYNGGLGLYLRGDDGNEYYYSHMSSFVVRRGRVHAGQLVARVGDTGNARGGAPHVHFEVHPGGGSPVNPYPYVRRFCG